MDDQYRNTLAANWDPEILAQYMASVAKENERAGFKCLEDEDAEMTDEEVNSDDEDAFATESSFTSQSSALSEFSVSLRPDDITSDDSGFSSDDEFADDNIREAQDIRRQLILGTVPSQLLAYTQRQIVDMSEGYMKQLDDADMELAEIQRVPAKKVERRKGCEDAQKVELDEDDKGKVVMELRKRSRKEVAEEDKKTLLLQLVWMAQDLFRKEKLIKSTYKIDED